VIKTIVILFSLFFVFQSHAAKTTSEVTLKKDQNINIITSQGTIGISLFQEKNSDAADYFLKNIKSGSYNKTIFHRIVDGFVLQGGIYDASFQKKDVKTEKIDSSTEKKIKNRLFTLALIRDPQNQAILTDQFFINLTNNTKLDEEESRINYEVIGEVTDGFDVIQKIARVKIGQREGLYNVPFYPEEATIKSIEIVKIP
jgi:cyclophilin family peptidyl-prolyl cis-trans isomerase